MRRSRVPALVKSRVEAMRSLRHGGMSYKAIARAMGMHHATVMYHLRSGPSEIGQYLVHRGAGL